MVVPQIWYCHGILDPGRYSIATATGRYQVKTQAMKEISWREADASHELSHRR